MSEEFSPIVTETFSELPPDQRKTKARIVFQGSWVRDGEGQQAVFDIMGSTPSTIESSKHLDCWGGREGYAVEIADGVRAYTQVPLQGPATWCRLADSIAPPEWKAKFRDPVCLFDGKFIWSPVRRHILARL